jgi:MFS family permease
MATASPEGRNPTVMAISDSPALFVRHQQRNGFIGAALGWMFDGYETFATVLIAPTIVNELIGPGTAASQPIYVGGILATTLVAWGFGGLLSGILADYIGRRRVLMYSILWYSVFAAAAAFSPNYTVLLILRFLTGVGMGAEWGAGSSLVSEIWDDRNRGKGIALLQGSFGVGFLLAAGAWQIVNTGSPDDWRWMYILGAAPALVSLFVRRRVKDPDIWVAVDNKRRDVRLRIKNGEIVRDRDRQLTKSTLAQLFQSPERRRRIILLFLAALSTTMGWWAVSSWIPLFSAQQLAGKVPHLPSAITTVVVAYNVVGLAGYFMMGVLADWLGRKAAMMIYFAGSLVVVPLLFLTPASPPLFIALAALNGFFTMGQWTWVALYPAELFPTQVRATAIAFVFNTTRFVVAAGTLLSAAAIHFFGSISVAATVLGSGYIIGLLVTPWIGPETKGLPLPGPEDAPDESWLPLETLAAGHK